MIFSSLSLNKEESINNQIKEYIKSQIYNGIITKGSKLPSTREAAKILGISRNTLIISYEELESEGIIETVKGRGTFVSKSLDIDVSKNTIKNNYDVNWDELLNLYGKSCRDLDIMKSENTVDKIKISFKSIAPEDKLFDMEDFKRSFQNVCSREGSRLLNYGYAKGYKPLIDFYKDYMENKGVCTEGKDILITNGFTEAFDIILSSLIKSGDYIITESPTHNTAIKIMKAHGVNIIGIPMNKDGIDIDELVDKVKLKKPKIMYMIPSYHNPTGIVTSGEKRKQIYDICSQYNIPLIEDGFNEELMYTGSHIPPIISFSKDKSGIVYIGSLSKILFPGLRIGYIMADKELIDYLESVKRARSIHCSTLDQAILYDYLSSGAFEKYVKKVRKFYRDKYEFTLNEIKNNIPYEEILGEGGLHIFVKLKGISASELLSICTKHHVSFMCGNIFFPSDKNDQYIRLGFARLSEEEIKEGIRIISCCIKKLQNKC